MKMSYWKLGVLAISLLGFIACGKKNNDESVAVNGRDVRITGGPSGLPTGQGGVNIQATNLTPMDQSFEESVKVFASATVQPDLIGQIRNVDIAGRVSVMGTGSVVGGTTSYVQIAIFDSLVGPDTAGNMVQPIVIRIGNATGQAIGSNVNLTFSDDYGSITITGTYDNYANSMFRGTVRFANKNPGLNNKREGTLGSFVIPTCAFFVCN